MPSRIRARRSRFVAARMRTSTGTGAYSLSENGLYTLEAWHETFGTVTAKVTVKDGETKERSVVDEVLAPAFAI